MIKRVHGARDTREGARHWPRVPRWRRPPGPGIWMETMFLVAGLAVAVVAGILAAVYFSIRSGKRGGQRLRPAGAGRVGADRAAASRPGAIRRPPGRVGGAAKTGGQTEFALRASGPARAAAGNRPARAQASTLTESWPAAPSDLD